MLRVNEILGASSVLAVLLAQSCVYPTDRSDELRVVIDSVPELLRGDFFLLSGAVLDAAGATVSTTDVAFSSDNPLVAAVGEAGEVLAVAPGVVNVTATALGFAGAVPDIQQLQVHDLLEVDSVRPVIVQFGDTLQFFGTGLNPEPFLLVSLGGVEVPIKSFVPVDPADSSRFGVLTVWVPVPTPKLAQAFVLGVEGLVLSPDTTRVLQWDIYEPNDTVPWDFGTLASPIRNPALAFEVRPRDDSLRVDWYRFTTSGTADRSIKVRAPQQTTASFQVFFTDSLWWNSAALDFAIGSNAWTIGPSSYSCGGLSWTRLAQPFAPPQLPTDSVIIALQALPAGTYDLIGGYSTPGGYSLEIVEQYVSVLPPDAAEENDYCNVAKPIALAETQNLTIDNPRDVDWFTFTITGAPQDMTFVVKTDDPEADLDVYIVRDDRPADLPVILLSQIGGDIDGVSGTLAPADYFLVVVDFAGIPTSYTLTSTDAIVPIMGPSR